MTFPSLPTRNFVKFHLMASTRNPPFSFFRNLYSGSASSPFTLIFWNSSGSNLNLSATNALMSISHDGSWPPNWLHGNASTSRPSFLYLKGLGDKVIRNVIRTSNASCFSIFQNFFEPKIWKKNFFQDFRNFEIFLIYKKIYSVMKIHVIFF